MLGEYSLSRHHNPSVRRCGGPGASPATMSGCLVSRAIKEEAGEGLSGLLLYLRWFIVDGALTGLP